MSTAVQTSYGFGFPKGVAGGLFDLSAHDVTTRQAEGDGVAFGLGVVVGTNKGTDVKLPASITLSAFSLMVPTFLCTLCPRLKLMERSTQTGHIRLLIRFLRISMACRNLLTRLQCLSKSLIH